MNLYLIFFHRTEGPIFFYSKPEKPQPKEKDLILNLMDMNIEHGFFEYEYKDFKLAANLFQIDSLWARGQKEMLMLVLSSKDFKNQSLAKYEKAFEKLILKFKNFSNIFMGLYEKVPKNFDTLNEIAINKRKIHVLLDQFYKKCNYVSNSIYLGNFLVLGFNQIGKYNLVEYLTNDLPLFNKKSPIATKMIAYIARNSYFDVYELSTDIIPIIKKRTVLPNGILVILDKELESRNLKLIFQQISNLIQNIKQKIIKSKRKIRIPIIYIINQSAVNKKRMEVEALFKISDEFFVQRFNYVPKISNNSSLMSFKWIINSILMDI